MASVSVLITTFKRARLLYWGLVSIAKQKYTHDVEVVILNEEPDERDTLNVCRQFYDKIDIRHIHTAKTKESMERWRVPGYALNIGVKQSESEYIFISCAEMFHVNDCIQIMTDKMEESGKVLTVPNGRDDLSSNYLNRVQQTDGNPSIDDFNKCGYLNVRIPFLMGCRKEDFSEIGGYDEDFKGVGFEDNDFVDRMNANGSKHIQTDALAVHLYHQRIHANTNEEMRQGMILNQNLYLSRRGQIKRNIDKEWGSFDENNF